MPFLPQCAFAQERQPWPWQIDFQAAASPTMERIAALTLSINLIIVAIVVLVTALVVYAAWRFRASRNPNPARWTHNTRLEIAWTTIPVIILLAIAFPSFRLLYFMDRVQEADMTLKVTGHQWYWSYEYPDHGFTFDALMVQPEETKPGQPRLLATDNPVVLPVGVPIRIQLTADDVIHSWAVPAFGIKTDTVPGRLNETWVQVDQPGIYYGQCSELCGVNHAFMPVMIRAVPKAEFDEWVSQAKQQFARQGERQIAEAEAGGADRGVR
ncbi:MAG: cytochrome c oxidase subunit II [Rhodospirillales bacterium]|nr:cytochrome c oxidase subunit II [Rhodospirillales bacterium]